jgi:hypothetical protein
MENNQGDIAMSNTTKYIEEHLINALRILSYDPPTIRATALFSIHKEHADKLIECGAIEKTAYLEDVYVFNGHSRSSSREVITINKTPYYFCSGYLHEVDEISLRVYISVFDWSFRKILYGLGASEDHKYKSILDEFIWDFGNIYIKQHKIPVILVRCITTTEVLMALAQYLNKYHTKTPALVLIIELNLPIYFSIAGLTLGKGVTIDILDIIVNDQGNVYFNIDFILDKMGKNMQQEGFSDGYRSAYFKGQSFTFTKKESEAIEFIHKNGNLMHQNEIMAHISPYSSQTKLSSIFRSKGKMNPAWGKFIISIGNGYYKLDL